MTPKRVCADCGTHKGLFYCPLCDAYYCAEHCCYSTELATGNEKAKLVTKKSIRRKRKQKDE